MNTSASSNATVRPSPRCWPTKSEPKVFGLVHIPKRNQDTFGRDIEDVIARKLTFEEAIRNGTASVMSKQRLKVVQRDLFEQLDRLSLL